MLLVRCGRIPARKAWRFSGFLAIAWLLAVSACAVRPGGEGTYRDPHGRFTLRPPPTPWEPFHLDGASLAFRLPSLAAGMGLRVDCSSPEPGPLPAVARHLFFGLRDSELRSKGPVVVADADGIRTRLVARLEQEPVEVETVTLRHRACLYDFLYVAPPATFALGKLDFESFVHSWAPAAGSR